MITITSFTFGPLAENTYLLHNENGELVIIDPGCYTAAERKVVSDFIAENKLSPKLLLNTHCHLDHVFGNKFIAGNWNLSPWLHAAEQPVLENAPLSGLQWGLPFDGYTGPLHFLREGDIVSLGDDTLKVIFAPGHSPGHCCFYCSGQQFLIGGDVLFRMGIGRTDLPGGDFDVLLNSIRRQLFTLPPETIVYPGHGEPTTIAFEMKHNPFLG
jgi:hydroxyacylglutathione hydrolase